MFGIGSTELLVIFVVALIVLGPKSIPQIAKTLGKAMGEFKRVSTEFQRTMNAEVELDEHEKRKKEAEQELFGDKAGAQGPAAPSTSPTAAPKAQAATPDADTSNSTAASAPEHAPASPATEVVETEAFAPDSPLARAVAKAEAEAAERNAAPAASTTGTTDSTVTEPKAKA